MEKAIKEKKDTGDDEVPEERTEAFGRRYSQKRDNRSTSSMKLERGPRIY